MELNEMAQQASENGTQFQTALYREIYKNSWLKKTSKSKRKKENLWVVFCVHDDTNAFLETYLDNKIALLHKPDWFVSLNSVQHVTTTICSNEQEYEFVVTLSCDSIKFAASSHDMMMEWVESLRGKLNELRILDLKENVYSKLPDSRIQALLPRRDPTSPLPPPPLEEVSRSLISEVGASTIESRLEASNVNLTPRRRSSSVSSCDSFGTPSARNGTNDVFQFDHFSEYLNNPPSSAPPSISGMSHYDHVFQLGNADSSGPSTSELEFNASLATTSRAFDPPPRSYKTLREQQVLQLQKEMVHPGGIRLQLRRRDCVNAVALIDAFSAVWISGWKQKEHPMLYNALHIGDQLLSIEGAKITSVYQARRLLKTHNTVYVNLIVRRIPFGQVYVIHRDVEGQPLGLIQENNTATIEMVEPNSLAARHGLSTKSRTCDGTSFTNWVLTEINGRPLNLFFKKNQVRDRLNSVGRDISILVQPLDLIKQIKKELKSIRNYKEYLLQ